MFQCLVLPSLSPALLMAIANYFADWPGTCLLHSSGQLDSARNSFLGLFPFETVNIYAHQLYHRKGNQYKELCVSHPWEGLQEHFFLPLAKHPLSIAFGWLGYGMGAFADEEKALPYRSSHIPDAYWQRCALQLTVDWHTQQANVQVDLSAMKDLKQEAKDWVERLSTLEGWLTFIKTISCPSFTYTTFRSHSSFLHCPQRKAIYLNKVQQAQELIRAGEVYQVNLSQKFDFQSSRHPFSLFRQVCHLNPTSFSAYFCHEKLNLISISPERFLCKKGQELETRPIKGTIQRGQTIEEDGLLKERLLSSAKERAELLMITDLMRNDLGKISSVGSVETLEIWRCESYASVFHLLSIIRSLAKPGLAPLDIIRSCFPGGSITGCPKLRAMEVIDELEERPRGIYTGSIGYVTGSGDFDLNIAIRTLVRERECYSLQLGSGIVIDSNPEQEYQETLFKGASIFHILQTKEILCD
jgi:para-aminobenzoate synthetase component 1